MTIGWNKVHANRPAGSSNVSEKASDHNGARRFFGSLCSATMGIGSFAGRPLAVMPELVYLGIE